MWSKVAFTNYSLSGDIMSYKRGLLQILLKWNRSPLHKWKMIRQSITVSFCSERVYPYSHNFCWMKDYSKVNRSYFICGSYGIYPLNSYEMLFISNVSCGNKSPRIIRYFVFLNVLGEVCPLLFSSIFQAQETQWDEKVYPIASDVWS